MEAFEFLKEAQRMCKTYAANCECCPLKSFACGFIRCLESFSDADMRSVTKVIEQWSKVHPLVTNRIKIREVFGDEAMYTISSPNVQALKDWLDGPYKEPEHEL